MIPTDIEQRYHELLVTPTDIFEHLSTMVDLTRSLMAENIIELGVRYGVSTVAWLYGLHRVAADLAGDSYNGHLWSVDPAPGCDIAAPDWTLVVGHDLDAAVMAQLPERADIVFIDTSHEYLHTVAELAAYWPRVAPGGAMVLHDTAVETFEHHAPGSQPPFPVRRAVEEFADEVHVDRIESWDNNNGLSVLYKPVS